MLSQEEPPVPLPLLADVVELAVAGVAVALPGLGSQLVQHLDEIVTARSVGLRGVVDRPYLLAPVGLIGTQGDLEMLGQVADDGQRAEDLELGLHILGGHLVPDPVLY